MHVQTSADQQSKIKLWVQTASEAKGLKGQFYYNQSRLNRAYNQCPRLKMNTVTENYWLIYAAAMVI